MGNLSGPEQQRALETVTWWCLHRFKGLALDDERLSKLGFVSVDAMRTQLKNWELPEWLVEEYKARNPGAGTGQHRELPPPVRAVGLFQERLEALQVLLRDAEDLEHRQESYQDGRFPGADVYEGTLIFSRYRRDNEGRRLEIYSEQQWRKLCEQYGQDPEEEHFGVMDSVLQAPTEAVPAPPEPLTTLIGIYALAGGQIEPLLEALYPGEPSREVLEEVRKCVEGKKKTDKKDGLKTLARQLAVLARGGGLRGAPPIALSSEEHDAACYITQLRDEDRPEEDILRSLSNHRKPDGSKLTKEDVDRLGLLRLRYPKP